jgi:hypothetical protein
MSCPSHPPRLHQLNHFWLRLQVMKLLIMQFFSAPYYFVPLSSKYSPQHPILKQLQSMFFLQCYRSSYIKIQNHRQNYNFVYINLYPFSPTMTLASTKSLTDVSTRSLPGDKWRPVCEDENITAICERCFYIMRDALRLTALKATTAC